MAKLATPKYDLSLFPHVYEPSEDTFLFLDALELETPFLRRLGAKLAAEIGSGSGVVISGLAAILGATCAYFATDINPSACQASKLTAKLNDENIECLNMHLVDNFNCKFDVILFNPPYVVTDDEEVQGNGLNRAWAGGRNGRQVINMFLDKLDDFLSDKGVFYMVLVKENNPESIESWMAEKGFFSALVVDRKVPGEHLFVYKYWKKIKKV